MTAQRLTTMAFIVVLATSSATTGDFENFIARDVVSCLDAHYRTIPNRNSRGLVGHSMGARW